MRLALLTLILTTSLWAQEEYYDPYDYGYEYDMYDDEAYYDDEEYFYYCEPYCADCDQMWYWEDEAVYPTRRDDTWVDELTKPW